MISTAPVLIVAAQAASAAASGGQDAARTAPARPGPEQGVASPTGDVVVVARRRGDATVPSDTEIDEGEIAARGADSIGTLLDRLRPFIDETGEEPVLLVNGRPLGLDRSLLSFPPEALERVAVLRRDAAAQYGQPGDRRVVNLVLKEHFASTDTEAGLFGSTAGGQTGGLLTARRVAIDRDTRWNANARYERQSALLRSARDLPPRGAAPTGVGAGVDPDEYETLLPSRRNLVGSVGVTRPVGTFSGSVTIDASDIGGAGLRGLPPGADATARPLRSSNAARSLGSTMTLSGTPGGWQTNLSANVTRSWSESLLESALVGTTRNRATNDSVTARLNVNKSLLSLPAGPLTTSYTLNLLQNRSSNRQSGAPDDPIAVDIRTRRQLDGEVAIGIPLSRRDGKTGGPLGRMSAQLSFGAHTLSGAGTRTEIGGGLIWSPVPALELRGNVNRAGTSPSVDQLDAPLVTTVVRLFDFRQQETVDVARQTGGNPLLTRGRREQMTLSAKLLPFADPRLTFSTTYRRQALTGGALAFPELTPAIEAAFPERVTRGPDGRLLAIDARPIAIASDESAELFSSVSMRLNRRGPRGRASAPPPTARALWTFDASLSHRWRLRDRLLVRDGVPPIDRLGDDGGQSRHTFSFQSTAARRGLGVNASASWSTTTTVRGTDATSGAFRVRSPILLTLDLFVRPDELGPKRDHSAWYANTTITVLIQNVLNDYRRVTTGDGGTPSGYSRGEIDPAGRTIRIVARKRF